MALRLQDGVEATAAYAVWSPGLEATNAVKAVDEQTTVEVASRVAWVWVERCEKDKEQAS